MERNKSTRPTWIKDNGDACFAKMLWPFSAASYLLFNLIWFSLWKSEHLFMNKCLCLLFSQRGFKLFIRHCSWFQRSSLCPLMSMNVIFKCYLRTNKGCFEYWIVPIPSLLVFSRFCEKIKMVDWIKPSYAVSFRRARSPCPLQGPVHLTMGANSCCLTTGGLVVIRSPNSASTTDCANAWER